jgi:hypothetical protein
VKNIEYRIWGATMRLVIFVFLVATLLLLLGKVTAAEWVNVTMGGVFAFVLRDTITKASEAYRDARIEPRAPQ